MSLNARIDELERRHDALERELKEANQHLSLGDLELRELKRQKLQIRDEIAWLQKTSGGELIH